MGTARRTGHHRRRNVQSRTGRPASPLAQGHRAPKRERSDHAGFSGALRRVRRGHDPEYRQGGTYRYYSFSKAMKQGKTACVGRRVRMDRLDGIVLDHLSEQLFPPERLTHLLQAYMTQANEGRAGQREKLRQTRDARGRVDAAIARLLGLVESGAMEPDAPELRHRLVALRLQKAELDRDIARLHDNLQTGQLELSPEKLQTLSMEMRHRLAEGPPELRQAYMKLLLEAVTVDHHTVRLEGSPAVLEKLASRGLSKSSPEVLSFVREWRPREDSNLRPPV
jgi:site-specific DNA recombinase